MSTGIFHHILLSAMLLQLCITSSLIRICGVPHTFPKATVYGILPLGLMPRYNSQNFSWKMTLVVPRIPSHYIRVT
jgi:hypothetical protein